MRPLVVAMWPLGDAMRPLGDAMCPLCPKRLLDSKSIRKPRVYDGARYR
jgi:hypothetical protein